MSGTDSSGVVVVVGRRIESGWEAHGRFSEMAIIWCALFFIVYSSLDSLHLCSKDWGVGLQGGALLTRLPSKL